VPSSTTTTFNRLDRYGTATSGSARHAELGRPVASAARADHAPTLVRDAQTASTGRVPLVIELKGIPGHDGELVANAWRRPAAQLFKGKAAIMSFDHWLIRDGLPTDAAGHPGRADRLRPDLHQRARGAFLDARHTASPSSPTPSSHLPNRFVRFVRDKARHAGHHLDSARRSRPRSPRRFAQADQMTFEGFDPDALSADMPDPRERLLSSLSNNA
jgi:hypothetical protein